MKVLAAIVIPPHLSASGAVNAAIALSQCLTKHCDIDVALMSDHDGETKQGDLRITHRCSSNRLKFTEPWLPNKYRTLFYHSDIAKMVDQYDMVHIHNPIPALEMRNIAQTCVAKNKPYVLTTHGFVEVLAMQTAYRLGFLEALGGRLFVTRPLNYVIKHAHKICCLAPQDQAMLAQRKVPYEKMVVIPNGVNLSFYEAPSDEDMAMVCAKFKLPPLKAPDVPVCFFLANHTRNKGLDILMDAFLASDAPFCLIVGGKKRDYDYKGYSSRAKANQQVVFTDGLSDQEIRALHHYADLFVFPSRADTLPLVVLEAMAAGRPVLSTRVGGIPYQIDESCGRLVEPENPEALRIAFEELTTDRPRLAAMGKAALKKVRSQFNWENSAKLTFEIYKQALGLPPSESHREPSPLLDGQE